MRYVWQVCLGLAKVSYGLFFLHLYAQTGDPGREAQLRTALGTIAALATLSIFRFGLLACNIDIRLPCVTQLWGPSKASALLSDNAIPSSDSGQGPVVKSTREEKDADAAAERSREDENGHDGDGQAIQMQVLRKTPITKI